MPNRTLLNSQLSQILTAVVDIPQHLQANQLMLDYVDQSISGHTHSLFGLSDVSQMGPFSNRHFLFYNAGDGKWKNGWLNDTDIPNIDMAKVATGSLPWSRVSGTPTTLSGYGITDSVVLQNGSYANPSWVTSLAWSKLTGRPTTLAGYGITDALSASTAASTYVPYTGASTNLDLNTKTIISGKLLVNGMSDQSASLQAYVTGSNNGVVIRHNSDTAPGGMSLRIEQGSLPTGSASVFASITPFGKATFSTDGTGSTAYGLSVNSLGVTGSSIFKVRGDKVVYVGEGVSSQLIVNGTSSQIGTLNSASGSVTGRSISNTLNATVTNDTLTAVDINPTFTTGGGVTASTNIGLRVRSGMVLIGTAAPLANVGTVALQVAGGVAVSDFATAGQCAIFAGSSGALNKVSNLSWLSGNNALIWWGGSNAASTTNTNKLLVNVGSPMVNYAAIQARGGIYTADAGDTSTMGATAAESGIARAWHLANGLRAIANNDVLVGMDITPTFYDGLSGGTQFTGLTKIAARFQNGSVIIGAATPSAGVTQAFQVYGSAYVSSNLTVNSLAGTGIRAAVVDAAGGLGASSAWTISGNNIWMNAASANITNSSTFAINYSGVPSYAGAVSLAVRGGAFFGDNGSTDTGGALSAASGIGRGVYMRHGIKATATNDVLVGLDIQPTFYSNGQTGVTSVALRVQGDTKVTGKLNVGTTADYADNAAALAAGLVVGDVYRTGDVLKVVH
ncbi:MAG: hypothetical protein EOO97_00045 [Pedobacter sp.]|nr:MAG: hypothetical protein EOO97_00045 [Pedobacter sp.]